MIYSLKRPEEKFKFRVVVELCNSREREGEKINRYREREGYAKIVIFRAKQETEIDRA